MKVARVIIIILQIHVPLGILFAFPNHPFNFLNTPFCLRVIVVGRNVVAGNTLIKRREVLFDSSLSSSMHNCRNIFAYPVVASHVLFTKLGSFDNPWGVVRADRVPWNFAPGAHLTLSILVDAVDLINMRTNSLPTMHRQQ
jgi:hypothetical protein